MLLRRTKEGSAFDGFWSFKKKCGKGRELVAVCCVFECKKCEEIDGVLI